MTSPTAAIPATPAPQRMGMRLGWAVGSIGTITVLNTYSLLLLYYLTAVLGIAPALAGTMLFAAKLVDAVLAPVLGSVSDRTVSRFGRRRPYLAAGAVTLFAAFAVTFNPLALEGTALIGWIGFGLLLFAVGYTLFNVPYIAMPAEMTDDPNERTAMMTWRVSFLSLGNLIVLGATTLVQPLGGGRIGYGRIGLMLGAVVLVSMLFTFFATARARATMPVAGAPRERLASAFANRPFAILIAAKVLQLIGLASFSAAILFFITGVLGGGEGLVAVYGLSSTVATVLSMPLWSRVSRALGRRETFIAGCVIFSAVTLSWLLAERGEPLPLILLRGVISGIGAGGVLLMGQAILPDTIAYDAVRTGARREGLFAGAYSFVEKSSMAFGPLVVGALLQSFGFDPQAGPGAVQGAEAQRGVIIGASVLPAILYLASCVPLYFYRLTPADLAPKQA